VRIVPALQPYVEPSPQIFANISPGQTNTIALTISASSSAVFGTIDGTLQLRTGNTIAQPLPIKLDIWPSTTTATGGITVSYPPDWSSQQDGQRTVITNAPDFSQVTLENFTTFSFFAISVLGAPSGSPSPGPANPDQLPITKWFKQYFAQGFASPLVSKSTIHVAGRDAIRITGLEIGGNESHVYVPNGSDVIEIVFPLSSPQFNGTYEEILSSIAFSS
jgi:hypothetical protein